MGVVLDGYNGSDQGWMVLACATGKRKRLFMTNKRKPLFRLSE